VNGRTKPYFFAFETKTKPGKIVAHCVRIETLEVDAGDGFDRTKFTILGADCEKDTRILLMLQAAHGFVEANNLQA